MRVLGGGALRQLGVAACVLVLTGCSSGPSDARADRPSPAPSTPSASPTPTPTPTPSAPAKPKPPPVTASARLPLSYSTGDATQAITVIAGSTGDTTATLQAWTKTVQGWVRRGPASHAYLGKQGMTAHPSESLAATPMGSFSLTQAFGLAGDPGTRLPYFSTDSSDYWVADQNSAVYNTHYRCSRNCPFDTGAGENLYRVGYIYTYAVVMDYNRFPVRRGAGSAFFLHVTEYKPTTGCISIPRPDLVSIMRWLDPAAHPRILVGNA
ncbi:MAG: L,D-transpeptidase family protein [Mycobacteriales bacterium]